MSQKIGYQLQQVKSGIKNPHINQGFFDYDGFWWPTRSSQMGDTLHSVLNRHFPVRSYVRGITSFLLTRYSDDYYHRVHIAPTAIELGNVVSTKNFSLYVWNAHFQTKQLSAITGEQQGITLHGQKAPYRFGPLEELNYTVGVRANGPSTIDNWLTWFVDKEMPRVHLTGSRVVAFSFMPDWTDGMTERLEWATDIVTSETGIEPNTSYNLKIYLNDKIYQQVTGITNNSYVLSPQGIEGIIADDCLMQFNTVTGDDAGNQWVVNGNPKIIEDTQAIAGKCLELAGDSYLTTDNADIYHFGLGAFTIECWCKPDPNKTESTNVILSSKSSAGHIFSFGIGSKYYPGMYIDFTQPNGSRIASGMGGHSNDLYDGNFHHIAVVRDDKGYLSWFFDGKKAQWTNTYNWSNVDIESDNICNLGCFTANNYHYFGNLDQLRITKQALYLEEFTPSREPYIYNDGKSANFKIELGAEREGVVSHQKLHHEFSYIS